MNDWVATWWSHTFCISCIKGHHCLLDQILKSWKIAVLGCRPLLDDLTLGHSSFILDILFAPCTTKQSTVSNKVMSWALTEYLWPTNEFLPGGGFTFISSHRNPACNIFNCNATPPRFLIAYVRNRHTVRIFGRGKCGYSQCGDAL